MIEIFSADLWYSFDFTTFSAVICLFGLKISLSSFGASFLYDLRTLLMKGRSKNRKGRGYSKKVGISSSKPCFHVIFYLRAARVEALSSRF